MNEPDMNEPNETPQGRLADYLIGDLGPARRLLAVAIGSGRGLSAGSQTILDIRDSVELCVRRIERDCVSKTGQVKKKMECKSI
jgi:hypothetical protein